MITASDGGRWRVTAVRPQDVLGERRRGDDRRVTPVESLLDPPVLQRRRGDDRRVFTERRHALPGQLLPREWHDGWLLFEALGGPADTRDVRRRAPIPEGWATLPDAALALELSRASRPRD
ncbi:MAG: hypothetical protein ACXWZS_14725 [Gemmatirosa sp.]